MRKLLNKSILSLTVVTLALLSFGVLAIAATPEQPILVTSAGQSADDMILRVMLGRLFGEEVDREPMAAPADLEGKKSLALVVGVSNKGLGSAGINLDQEFERIQTLLEAAKENDIHVFLLHIGGPSRRGAGSDQVAELVSAYAHHIIVTAESNQDNYFDDLAEKNGAEVLVVETRNDAAIVMVDLFK
ncbi:MAG TPA: DUF6305 family protein [Limnochordia bacterium]|nr:DUF6305 family protein [Limnochordia bacterium]